MAIDFKNVTGLTIGGKEVVKIEDSASRVLWELNNTPQYTQLTYIYTNSSDAVFDLECKVDGDSKWVLDYAWRANYGNESQVGAEYFLWVVTETVLYVYNSVSRSDSGGNFFGGYRYTQTIDQKAGTAEGIYNRYFTGIRKAGYTAEGVTLSIGGRHYRSGSYGYKHPYTFYSSKLYDKNGTLVSDVIPIRLTADWVQDGKTYTSGTLGLYDKATNRFLPKIGNGSIGGV